MFGRLTEQIIDSWDRNSLPFIIQSHAETCPVCWGKGKIKTDSTSKETTCHGCGGLGWVKV